MQRITITIEDDLLAEIDAAAEARGYQNRSEIIRDLARAGLQQSTEDTAQTGQCVAGLIYVYDQKLNLVVVALEIVKRFYLTIGFAALLILAALAITSTNGWQKRLRANWKRLHWLIYPAAVLAILHFFIQSKNNVGEATVAAGLFAWLMIWRWMPARLRARYLGLALLAIAATLSALAFEVAWYALVKNVDPLRILAANIDPDLAPRPALKVVLVALAAIVLAAAWRNADLAKRLWTKRYIRKTIPTS